MSYWLGYFFILIAGTIGLIAALVYAHRVERLWLEKTALAVLSLFMAAMFAEFYFKVFFAQPDAPFTLAMHNWHQKYYEGTINSLGYRDVEWANEMVMGKTKVMIVGDSFVEGVGIEDPKDRFPDQLAKMLGSDYVVLNLGKRRANTVEEIEAIINYPYAPDILVLSYFVNDIDNVRWWFNFDREPSMFVPAILSPLVNNSYAFNFLYWRLFRLLQFGQPDAEWSYLLKFYNDPNAWWLHHQDLLSIHQGAQAEQIPLVVVVFPSMNRTEESKVVTKRIINLFEERDVPVLDVSVVIEDIPVDERVASPFDPHPSELVHKLVAEALYQKLAGLGLTVSAKTQ